MQSGIHRGSFVDLSLPGYKGKGPTREFRQAHLRTIQGLCTDVYNQQLITASLDGTLKVYFLIRKVTEIDLEFSESRIVGSDHN